MRRLIDEHWRAAAIAAVHRYRESDPQDWSDYLAGADELAGTDAPVSDDSGRAAQVSRPPIEPGQVWFVDFDPVQGREQGRGRPALVVSSRFHPDLTVGRLASVLPLTSVERPGWMHRVHPASGGGWVITEQIRTVSTDRFRRYAPEIALSEEELAQVRDVLGHLLVV